MTIFINLDSRYTLTADKYQWILLQDGRAYWFFESLESLLNNYLSLKIRGSNAKLVYSLIDTIKRQQQALHTLLTSLDFKTKLPILSNSSLKSLPKSQKSGSGSFSSQQKLLEAGK